MPYNILFKGTSYPNNPYITSGKVNKLSDAIQEARNLNAISHHLEHIVADNKGTIVWTPEHDYEAPFADVIDIRDTCKEAF